MNRNHIIRKIDVMNVYDVDRLTINFEDQNIHYVKSKYIEDIINYGIYDDHCRTPVKKTELMDSFVEISFENDDNSFDSVPSYVKCSSSDNLTSILGRPPKCINRTKYELEKLHDMLLTEHNNVSREELLSYYLQHLSMKYPKDSFLSARSKIFSNVVTCHNIDTEIHIVKEKIRQLPDAHEEPDAHVELEIYVRKIGEFLNYVRLFIHHMDKPLSSTLTLMNERLYIDGHSSILGEAMTFAAQQLLNHDNKPSIFITSIDSHDLHRYLERYYHGIIIMT